MPDSAHVLSFLSGLGQTLAGSLRQQHEEADAQKRRQEDFLDDQLLRAIQHPDTKLEDANRVMQDIIGRRAKAAGMKPNDVSALWSHVVRQVGTVEEPAPIKERAIAAFENAPAVPPVQRPMTVGDVENKQIGAKTRAVAEGSLPSKLAIAQQAGLAKSVSNHEIAQRQLANIQARGDVKANQAYQSRYLNNVRQGMSDEDAKFEAANYAGGLSDLVTQSKQSGIELNESRRDLIKRRTADISEDNARQDKALQVNIARLENEIKRTGLAEQRVGLSAAAEQLKSLRERRSHAAMAMRQAGAIAANLMADEHERQGQNIEWEKRRQEIEEIDRQIAGLNAALPSAGVTAAPKQIGKTADDPRIGKVFTAKDGKRYLIKSIGPDGQPIGVPAP